MTINKKTALSIQTELVIKLSIPNQKKRTNFTTRSRVNDKKLMATKRDGA